MNYKEVDNADLPYVYAIFKERGVGRNHTMMLIQTFPPDRAETAALEAKRRAENAITKVKYTVRKMYINNETIYDAERG